MVGFQIISKGSRVIIEEGRYKIGIHMSVSDILLIIYLEYGCYMGELCNH